MASKQKIAEYWWQYHEAHRLRIEHAVRRAEAAPTSTVVEDRAPIPSRSPSRLRAALNVTRRAAHAARSVAKTAVGIDRVTDEQAEARLNVCRSCPGGHAVWRDGDIHTCGPMLESMRFHDAGAPGTCGCILHRKARDLAEDCPFGWWPKPQPRRSASSGAAQ